MSTGSFLAVVHDAFITVREKAGRRDLLFPVLAFFALSLFLFLLSPDVSAGPLSPDGSHLKIEATLASDLDSARETLTRVQSAIKAEGLSSVEPAAIGHLFEGIRADDILVREHQQDIEKRLMDDGASSTVLSRHWQMSESYASAMDGVLSLVGDAERALGSADLRGLDAAIGSLIKSLEEFRHDNRQTISVLLPFRSMDLPQASPVIPAIQVLPAYLDMSVPQPTAQDLAESPEAGLDLEIVSKAAALNQNPIEIFEFVMNHVEAEFYHGSMKGAVETLKQGSGNDADQASLLVALMRASGIPARYVRGVAVISGEQALSWTGASSTRVAAELFTKAGIPFSPVRQGNQFGSFQIEHTWVEVYVPYANYRGAPVDATGKAWIPLDASIKSYQYAQGTDLLSSMNFNSSALVADYLSGPQALMPAEYYRQKIEDYLSLNQPAMTFGDVVGAKTLEPAAFGLLPSTLPYATTAISFEGPALPDSLRHKVRFVAGGEGAVSFDVTVPVSELMGRRLTLSYVPATVDDHIAVNTFVSLDNTPAYLVKLRPVLKSGGMILKAGEAQVQMGSTHGFTVEVQTPGGGASVTNSFVAGGYYAIGLGGRKAEYTPSYPPAPYDTEYDDADILYSLAMDYIEEWNLSESELEGILRVINVRPALSMAIVGNVYNSTLLFGTPQSIEWKGVFIDADLRFSEPVPVNGDAALKGEFMRLSGLSGSMLESGVFEKYIGVESVSAAKIIQLANSAGLPIEVIDLSNVGSVLPLIQTAASVKQDIADAVNQGLTVTVPRQDIAYDIFTGIGYIALDPATGAGGYFISGGLAGGMTASQWVAAQYKKGGRFFDPAHASTPPANTDPTAAFHIDIVPMSNHRNGVVGKKLKKPIIAWVRDKANRPVKGASVTFYNIQTAVNYTVATDRYGLARAYPELSTDTSKLPFYVINNTPSLGPVGPNVVQVGQNIIGAKTVGAGGVVIYTATPFQVFAYPDKPHHLTKKLGDGNSSMPGMAAGTLLAIVEDTYGNPVSNVDVEFASGAAAPSDPLNGPLPTGGFLNITLYPSTPRCLKTVPLLGDCNATSVVTHKSGVFGASAETILGNTFDTDFIVDVKAKGFSTVAPEVFTLKSFQGWRTFGSGTYISPTQAIVFMEPVNLDGKLINATKVGTTLTRSLAASLFIVEDEYEVRTTAYYPACGGATGLPCYRLHSLETTSIRPVDINKAGTLSFPTLGGVVTAEKRQETAKMTFNVLQGGGTVVPAVADQPIYNTGNGLYWTRFTAGPNPEKNIITATAELTYWYPSLDQNTGAVTPTLVLNAQFGSYAVTAVYGVKVTTDKLVNFKLDGDADFNTFVDADYDVKYTVEPAGYDPDLIEVDLFEVDAASTQRCDETKPISLVNKCKWTGLWVSRTRPSGVADGTVTVIRGTGFDYKKSYRLSTVIDRGTSIEVKSDPVDLVFLAGYATYTSYKARPGTGLDYSNPKVKPIRGANVYLVDNANNVLQKTATSETGFFRFDPPAAPVKVKLTLKAELGDPVHTTVRSNTNAGALYAFERPRRSDTPGNFMFLDWTGRLSFKDELAASLVLGDNHEFRLKSGWDKTTSTYTNAERESAPFSILDVVYGAERLIKGADPTAVFPPLRLFWSYKNRPAATNDYATGDLTSAHYTDGDIYLRGMKGIDTDEYDTHVLSHEWWHYFTDKFGRDDTIGGGHCPFCDDFLDPRPAFSEGFADALSGVVFDPPDPVYVDTSGPAQGQSSVVFLLDKDERASAVVGANGARVDGYYSELSVTEVMWDLFDSSSQDASNNFKDDDKVALGFKPIYDVLTGGMKTTPAHTTMFAFLDYLTKARPAALADINALANAENIEAFDEYGGDMTQIIYTDVTPNGPVVRKDAYNNDLTTDAVHGVIGDCTTAAEAIRDGTVADATWPHNKLDNRRFIRFTAPADGAYTITVTPTLAADDVFFDYNKNFTKEVNNMAAGGAETRQVLGLKKDGIYTFDVGSCSGTAEFTVKVTSP